MSLRHTLQGWFWDHSLLWRRPLRRLRESLSVARYRLRHRKHPQPPRVLPHGKARPDAESVSHPAVGVLADDAHREAAAAWIEKQTESSLVIWPDENPPKNEPVYWLHYHSDFDGLPDALVESLLMSAATDDAPHTFGGWAPPAPTVAGPDASLLATSPVAVLSRGPGPSPANPVAGRAVPQITAESPQQAGDLNRPLNSLPAGRAAGPYVLRGDIEPGHVHRHAWHCPRQRLASLPKVGDAKDKHDAALFLLPFLAVGGAERLLFDLLGGLRHRTRCLVVTLEPHRRGLGQTVDTCRELTSHVYTLGDWLPRPAHEAAVEHLLLRYGVRHLVCWNGNVTFYDAARRWKDRVPGLRLYNQLYNHQGGWIEHYGPRFIQAIDVHLAVNSAIAEALVERGVEASRVATVHHGVEVPDLVEPSEAKTRQQDARDALGLPPGLPEDAVVVGTFIRLHAQKRPLDILAVARRVHELQGTDGPPVHFLLVGGGPMDDTVDAELTSNPPPNLTRFGLRSDLDRLYDAVDICLMTSAYEGLPIFLLDGLARQRPCVATAVGEIPELLEDGGGVLVQQPADIDALAQGILSLRDPEHRLVEGRKGRVAVEARFSLEVYRERYERLLFGQEGDL